MRGYALLSPTLLIMAAAMAAPMVLLALYSFWSQEGTALETRATLAQYAIAIGRPTYRALFYRSLAISSRSGASAARAFRAARSR